MARRDHLRAAIGSRRVFHAGRLASYGCLDTDDCMREALNTGAEVADALRSGG